MDIFNETHLKIHDLIKDGYDLQSLDIAQLQTLLEKAKPGQDAISELEERLQLLKRIMSHYSAPIQSRIYELEKEEKAIQAREKGYAVGTYHYIDRHVGVYRVKEIRTSTIVFNQFKSGDHWPKVKKFNIDKLDSRMQPLRTKGPYRVNDTVIRNGREFTVIGYLGYRMVLKGRNNWGQEFLQIVEKKDEATYRHIII